jgi:bifunctional DNA-binding transcriptional regulator/antitoxin component of YhaV-PrlF toxin-antitoxin module
MSKKGQLVVPTSLRKMLGLEPEDKFIAYGADDYIIFKKVELPTLKKEYEKLVKATSKIAKKRDISIKTVEEEIADYRRKKRTRS